MWRLARKKSANHQMGSARSEKSQPYLASLSFHHLAYLQGTTSVSGFCLASLQGNPLQQKKFSSPALFIKGKQAKEAES
jgi:hypothetical protein